MCGPHRRSQLRIGDRWLRDRMANPLKEDSDISMILRAQGGRRELGFQGMDTDKVEGVEDIKQNLGIYRSSLSTRE